MPLYFNADHLPPAEPEYVAWVDVMGTQSLMTRSLRTTANFIFKLHAAALQAPREHVTLYPVMDGFYASARAQSEMLAFLRSMFEAVATEFKGQENLQHRFVVRGALAFGPVVHGRVLPPAASHALADNAVYRDQLLLGMPLVQAHLSESGAPPFGVAVHESARAFASAGDEPLKSIWWRWVSNANQEAWNGLDEALSAYFEWHAARSVPLAYAAERIRAHQDMAKQYFAL